MPYVVLYEPASPQVRSWREMPREITDRHLAFMAALAARKQLLAGGPFALLPDGEPLGMAILAADSDDGLWSLLRQDPLYAQALVRPRVFPWKPIPFPGTWGQ